MTEITFSNGKVGGDRLQAIMFGMMMDDFVLANPSFATKSFELDENDPYADPPVTHNIKVISEGDWPDFRKWCNGQDIKVYMRKKSIDANKVWWPSTVDIMVPEDHDISVLCKLKYEY